MNKLFTIPAAKKIRLFTCLLLVGILLFTNKTYAKEDGQALFNAHCASCHNPGTATLIGPGLHGILKKQSREWIHTWVKNSQAFIKSGDPDAQAIYNKFKVVMPPQPLNDKQIDAILAYIQNPPKSSSAAGGGTEAAAAKKTKPQKTPIYIIFTLVAVLLILRGMSLGIPYISPVLPDNVAGKAECCH